MRLMQEYGFGYDLEVLKIEHNNESYAEIMTFEQMVDYCTELLNDSLTDESNLEKVSTITHELYADSVCGWWVYNKLGGCDEKPYPIMEVNDIASFLDDDMEDLFETINEIEREIEELTLDYLKHLYSMKYHYLWCGETWVNFKRKWREDLRSGRSINI